MNTVHYSNQAVLLRLILMASVFLAGCASGPFSQPTVSSQHNIEGKWSWQQEGPGGPWHGNFVLEKTGDSYAGSLGDTSEGTYGDKISDIKVSNEHIKFTRQGRFSVQYWEGDLHEENGQLKIINGQWTDSRWGENPKPLPFSAEKTE